MRRIRRVPPRSIDRSYKPRSVLLAETHRMTARLPARDGVYYAPVAHGEFKAYERKAEMLQDLRHDLLLGDEGDDNAAAAARATENVFAEDAQEQFAPRNARIGTSRRQRLGWRRLLVRTDGLARSGRLHV